MKRSISILLILSGCSTTGRHFADAGQGAGKAAAGMMILPPLLPLSLATFAIACPIYYGGCLASGQKPENLFRQSP